jgi:hypothetical protein
VDDLRELGLVNGLKLTSEDFQPITAFQVSLKVPTLPQRASAEQSAAVALIHTPVLTRRRRAWK